MHLRTRRVTRTLQATGLCLKLSALILPATAQDLFSVNLYGFGRQNSGDVWAQPAAQETVRVDSGDEIGAPGFTSSGWQNVKGKPGKSNISSALGSSATLRIVQRRNDSPYLWTNTRSAATHGIPTASMLDGKIHGTFDPGDGSLQAIMEITDIPFEAYDLAVYFGVNAGLIGNARGRIRVNGEAERRFTILDSEPDGELVEMTDPDEPGNYMIIRGLSGSTLHLDAYGDGFNHLGPAGFQILASDRAREPLEITDFVHDRETDEITLTWTSFPGDMYGIYWSPEMEEFAPIINPAVPAHESDTVTTYGPFPSPGPDATKASFRIGPPNLDPPELERTWGNGDTIRLTFSEPIAPDSGLDPANYVVQRDGGSFATVESAEFHCDRNTIVLTTTEPLDPDADHTVTMNNLKDLAGYPLDGPNTGHFRTWDDNPDGVRVFILAGQSNMVGRGRVEIGHAGEAGAIGSLRYLAVNDPDNYARLLANPAEPASSSWLARDDVKLWWNRADLGQGPNIAKGNLGPQTVGENFGPEYGFGWAVGDQTDQPVLLIKSCWGGKSLNYDFRPPSATRARGGDVGAYYWLLLDQVSQILHNLSSEFPEWDGLGYHIAGFGWHQGWNDSLNQPPADEYEANLVDLINDLREEFDNPDLPISIGATGHGGSDQPGPRATLVAAQLAVADPELYPAFAGTVFTADTRPFWREGSVSPVNDGSHWNNNAESFFLIGDAMGAGILGMLEP